MESALEVLQRKLRNEQVVDRVDVQAAKAEFAAMSDATKMAKRSLLLDIRYRAKTGAVANTAKAELAAFQATMPERHASEALSHTVLDAGGNAFDVGRAMATEGASGVQEIAAKAMAGDVRGAVTHPLAATILGVTGMTLLSRWVLRTQDQNRKTSFFGSLLRNLLWFSGAVFAARVLEKYSA